MEKGDAPDLETLLLRFGEMEMEKEIVLLKAETTRLRAEVARKYKIIAALQQRLFGSSSEKLDPAQLQLEMDEVLLGKPRPPVIAPARLPSIPGSLLAAKIIADKYEDHLPHCRQSQRFRRRHDIGRQTLNTWPHATSFPSAKRSKPNSFALANCRSMTPPSTTSFPATARPVKGASGPTATSQAAPATSIGTPGAARTAC